MRLRNQQGAVMTEYAVLIMLVAVALISAVTLLAQGTESLLSSPTLSSVLGS
jgi:Flp pilus assembly pilin Flp